MKKRLFTIAIALFSLMNAKAQGTMIVHGTTSTKFYLVDNGHQIKKLFADEIWVSDPATEGGFRGITNSINLTKTPVSTYDSGDEPTYTIIACFEARRYNSGSCGPYSETSTSLRCADTNDTACSIKLANGTIIYSKNGDF